jgi:hypothetical protein
MLVVNQSFASVCKDIGTAPLCIAAYTLAPENRRGGRTTQDIATDSKTVRAWKGASMNVHV